MDSWTRNEPLLSSSSDTFDREEIFSHLHTYRNYYTIQTYAQPRHVFDVYFWDTSKRYSKDPQYCTVTASSASDIEVIVGVYDLADFPAENEFSAPPSSLDETVDAVRSALSNQGFLPEDLRIRYCGWKSLVRCFEVIPISRRDENQRNIECIVSAATLMVDENKTEVSVRSNVTPMNVSLRGLWEGARYYNLDYLAKFFPYSPVFVDFKPHVDVQGSPLFYNTSSDLRIYRTEWSGFCGALLCALKDIDQDKKASGAPLVAIKDVGKLEVNVGSSTLPPCLNHSVEFKMNVIARQENDGTSFEKPFTCHLNTRDGYLTGAEFKQEVEEFGVVCSGKLDLKTMSLSVKLRPVEAHAASEEGTCAVNGQLIRDEEETATDGALILDDEDFGVVLDRAGGFKLPDGFSSVEAYPETRLDISKTFQPCSQSRAAQKEPSLASDAATISALEMDID